MIFARPLPAAVLALLGCFLTTGAQAQNKNQQGALTNFALADPNATVLQRGAALATQGMCTDLRNSGLALSSPTPQGDLFRRCNELIQTAIALNPNGGFASNGRSLGLNSTQLLGALQQISGEEVSTRGELATQVSQGQFANVSGRLNALRLGTFTVLSRARIAGLDPDEDSHALALSNAGDVSASGPVRSAASLANVGYSDYGRNSISGGLQPVAYYYTFADAPVDTTAGDTAGSASSRSGPSRGMGQASGQITQHWGWFAEGSYVWGNRDQTAAEDGFDFKAESFTAGIDYNFGSAVLGGSIGYDHYKATFDNNGQVSGGDVTVKGISGSLYGAWFSDLLFVNGIVSYGSPTTHMTRNVVYSSSNSCPPATPCPAQDRALTSSPDSRYFAVGATVGHDFDVSSWDLEASLSANYRRVKIDSFAENDTSGGGLALAYDDQTIDSFRSIVGLNISRALSTSFGVVSPSARVEWHHEFKDNPRTLYAKYALDATPGSVQSNFVTCDSCFAFPTDRQDSDFGVVGAGLSTVLAHRLQAYLFYERLVGASNLTSNAIAIGIRGQF